MPSKSGRESDGSARPIDGQVQSLTRAFAVLKSFDDSSPAMTIAEVADRSGLDRAAARRYLLTLQALGYVSADGRRFSLCPRVLELGYRYLSALGIPRIAQPYLSRLAIELGESCAVTVLDGDEVAYVAVANAQRTLAIQFSVGNRVPAYCTSMGRVLLAGLPQEQRRQHLPCEMPLPRTAHTVRTTDDLMARIEATRAAGWSIVDQETVEGIRAVAAPIRDGSGRVVAAINVGVPTARVRLDTLRSKIRTRVLATAEDIQGQFVESIM